MPAHRSGADGREFEVLLGIDSVNASSTTTDVAIPAESAPPPECLSGEL